MNLCLPSWVFFLRKNKLARKEKVNVEPTGRSKGDRQKRPVAKRSRCYDKANVNTIVDYSPKRIRTHVVAPLSCQGQITSRADEGSCAVAPPGKRYGAHERY